MVHGNVTLWIPLPTNNNLCLSLKCITDVNSRARVPKKSTKNQPPQISQISEYFQTSSRRQTYGSCPPFWAVPSDLSWSGGPACGRPPDTPWSDCGTGGVRWRAATRYQSTRGSCLRTPESENATNRARYQSHTNLRPLYIVSVLVICQSHVYIT